ncbi:MAG: hypothetical protein GXP58_05905 [Deltaproteobacteria bacterium]|nr:hypothetical protein [Deltaproteobacteria bacterium]
MGRITDTVLKDFWIKVFSLVFAVFLWISIVGGESGEEFFVVPLTITNIPGNMIISNDVINYVNVRVRGRRGALRSLDTKQIHVILDLTDAREGENNMTIFPEEIQLPEGLSVVRVSPSRFTIQLDRLTEKWLLVVPSFLGAPAQGYKLGRIEVSPTKVPVLGLEEALLGQEEIETHHIELFGKKQSFTVEADLKPLNGNVHIKGDHKVKVKVGIVVKTLERTFKALPVQVRGTYQKIVLKPDKVSLTLSGPEKIIRELIPGSNIRVIVPAPQMSGTFDVTPEVVLPPSVHMVKMIPETIHVGILLKKAPAEKKRHKGK